MTDLPTELAAEIARVTGVKDAWQEIAREQPHRYLGLLFCTANAISEIDVACDAIASGDTAAMQAALEDLKGYGE